MKFHFYLPLMFICLFFYFGALSQTITTPKGSSVYCISHTENSDAELQSRRIQDSLSIISNGYNAKIIDSASNLYNCHFYAWHLSENPASNRYWLYPSSELLKFLEPMRGGDGSYLPVLAGYEDIANKILIGYFKTDNSGVESDHSLSFSRDPENLGKDWISKWGDGCLVRHAKFDHPYSKVLGAYNHYSYNEYSMIDWGTPEIDVPGMIYSRTSQTYDIFVDDLFVLTEISVSNEDLFISIGKDLINKKITLYPKSNAFGAFTITCSIENGCGNKKVFAKTISLGLDPSIPFSVLQGPWCMCAGESYYIRTQAIQDDYTFDWDFQYGIVEDLYRGAIEVTPYLNQGYLTLTTTNGCNVSNSQSVLYPSCGSSCSGYYLVYPNPASTSIQIEISPQTLEALSKVNYVNIKLIAQSFEKFSLSIFENYSYTLYSQEGDKKLSGSSKNSKVKIDISSLKRGNYFLEINNGVEIETHQVLLD